MDTTTFIALLRSSTGRELSGSEWGTIMQMLVTLEMAEGGPYAVALSECITSEGKVLSDSELQERKYVLNKTISEFLASHDVTLPHVEAFLAEKDHDEARMLASIRALAASRLKELPKEMQEKGSFVMERTLAGNPDKQMPLMPYYVRKALGTGGTQFTNEFIAELGLANVYFWTAFIIYDDLWDMDEKGDPHLLPIANLFARHYIDTFSTMLPNTDFHDFFHKTMDDLDAANNWETLHCRMSIENSVLYFPENLPSFADKAEENATKPKSSEYERKYQPVAGHVLGPIVMLLMLGYSLESAEVRNLIEYFKQYLIAMQLNDDLHDWKEDLQRGHISTVTVEILRVWKAKYPDNTSLHLEKDMPELEEVFWFEILEPLCMKILAHTQDSRNALMRLPFLEDTQPLEKYISKNEVAARKALTERKWSEDLLQSVDNHPEMSKT